jgi:hypothetical protein
MDWLMVGSIVVSAVLVLDTVRTIRRARANRAAIEAETAAIYREVALIEIEIAAIKGWSN